jgi:hypothetical protein
MTDKELRRLNRAGLLELLVAQGRELELLRQELAEAKDQLADRKLRLDRAGSIAEASLQLNGVFQAAQDACEQYIENIESLSHRQEQLCAQMERETQEKCQKMLSTARTQSQAYWDEVSGKIQAYIASYSGLKDLLEQGPSSGQEA